MDKTPMVVVPTSNVNEMWNLKSPDGGILAFVMAVVAAVLWARRKWSTDSKAVHSDKVESDLMSRMSVQLADAHKALEAVYRERNDLMVEVGGLRAQVNYLRLEDDRKEARIKALEKKLGIGVDTQPGKL